MANVFDRSPLGRLADEWEREAQLPLVLPQPKAEGAEPTRAQPPSDRPAAGAPADSRAPSVTSTTKDGKIVPPKDLVPLFTQAARKYKVPVNVLAALAAQESSFNPLAEGEETEYGRAKGLMQYLDSTAQSLGINPYDPAQAIDAAARQIRERLDRGYSMDEAVREHFAGPDRKKWGPKTERYGVEVLDKARRVDRTIFAPQQPAPKAEGQAAPGGQPDDEQFRRAAELVSRPQPTGSIGPAPERGIIDELGTAFQTVIGRTGAGGEDKRPLIARLEDAAGRVVDAVTPDSLQRGVRRGKQALMAAGDGLMPESVYGKEQDRFATAAVIGGLEREAARFPQDPARQAALVRIGEAKGFGEAAREIVKNPGAVADVVLESLGVAVPQLAVTGIAGAAGGAPASVIGAGASSFSTEYAQAILEAVQNAAGGDLTDVYDVARAMNDPEIMAAARERGVKRGIPIAVFDALTAGLAGQIIRRTRGAVQGTLGAAGEAAVQGLGGMAGETGAQLATDEWKPGEILLEGFAEVPTAAIEAPGNIAHARRNQRAQERDIANAAGTIDQLDEAGMATTAADLVTPRHDPPVSDAIDPDVLRQANEQMAAAQQPAPPPPQRSPMQSALDAATQAVAAAQPAQRAVLDIPSEGVSIEGQIVQQDETGTLFRTDDGREFMVPAGDPDATVRPVVAPEAELVQPEPVADTLAQIEAIRDPSSAKDAALITPNSEIPEGALDGLAVVETSQGLFVTSNPEKAAAAQVVGGQLTPDQVGELLGYTTPKDQNDGTVVQATDAAGNVVHEEATNAANLEAAAARAEEMAPDGGQVQITDAVQALGRREQGVAGEPAPASAAKRPLAEYSEPELRARLKYLRGQAKTSGWNKALIEERRAVEAEIDRRAVAAKETTDAVGQQPTPGDEPVRGAEAAAPAGSGEQAGGAEDARGAAGRRGGAEAAVPAVPEDVAGAGAAAEPQPALSEQPAQAQGGQPSEGTGSARSTPAPASSDPHAGKWFGSREKAEAYIAKKKAGDTHEVVQTGRVRFEIKPKAAAVADEVDEATAEFRRIRAPGNVVEDATGKVFPVTATNGREITITRRDGTSETVQASGYSPAVPKHPDAKFDLGDRVINKGRAGEIESFAYPRDSNGQPRYNVAFDDGVPSDSIAQNDLKRERPKAATPGGSVSAAPVAEAGQGADLPPIKADELAKLIADVTRRKARAGVKDGRVEIDGRPVAVAERRYTSADEALEPVARRYVELMQAEGRTIPADPAQMSRDQFVMINELSGLIGEFEITGEDIGNLVRTSASGGLSVDYDALYDRVQSDSSRTQGGSVSESSTTETAPAEPKLEAARKKAKTASAKREKSKYGRAGHAALRKIAEVAGLPIDPTDNRDAADMIAFFDRFYEAGRDGRDMPRADIHPQDARAAYEAGRKDREATSKAPKAPRAAAGEGSAAEKAAVTEPSDGDVPHFETYDDANDWIERRANDLGMSRRAFSSTDEYKAIYPQIEALYQDQKAKTAEQRMAALRDAGLAVGDRVQTTVPGMFLDGTDYSGTIVLRGGEPWVNVDGKITVSKKGRLREASTVRWDSRWKKQTATDAEPQAAPAPSPAPAATKAEAGGQQGAEPSTSQKHAEIDRGFEENRAAIERMGLRKGDTVSVPFGQERRTGTIKSIDADQGSLEIEVPGGRGGPMSLRVDARYAAKVEPEPSARATPLNDDFGNYAIPTGSQLVSQSGRELSPSPKWDDSTPRKRALSLKRQRAWLVDEAIKESEAGGPAQGFQTGMLRRINPDSLSRSDFDTVNDVLFGDPDGPKPEHFRAAPAKPAKAPAARKPSESTKAEAKAGPEAAPATNDAEWGANNTLVTRERAAELRERLKKKLAGQLNSGIDPEVLAIGAELAAFHIEAGARRFADFARAIARDLDTTPQAIRKYLRAWYNAGRDLMEDSGRDVSDMNTPDEVRAELAALVAAAQPDTNEQGPTNDGGTAQEQTDEPRQLGQPGPGPLEGAPAQPGEGAAGEGAAGDGPAPGGRADAPRDERAGSAGDDGARGLGDDPGAVSVSAGGSRGGRRAGQRGGTAVRGGADADVGSGPDRGGDRGGVAPAAGTPAPERGADFTIEEPIAEGGAKTKYRKNVEAIRLLKQLEAEGRQATRDEQAVLAQYVGWGGIPQAFERSDGGASKGWQREVAELKALLTPEEYQAASSSTRNAHYTSTEIVVGMWQAMRHLGFRGGRLLEPSVGVGNFFGLMPADLRGKTALHGVELDRITSGIVSQLYPKAKIARMGFQDYVIPDGYFDAVIGNPPFGREVLYDGRRKDLAFSIHNYFFAKAIDGLKPGGVLAMVVTNRMMDVRGDKARRYINDRADLVGAIRLPNNAFSANAGTEVTTDIIFLRKRLAHEAPAGESWMDVVQHTDQNGKTVPLNEYFARHPEMMLGDFGAYGSMYGPDEPALIARPGQDTAALLAEAISRLPADIAVPPQIDATPEQVTPLTGAENVRVGSMFMDGDRVMVRGPDELGEATARPVEFPSPKAEERVRGMIRVRDALVALRALQLDRSASDKAIEAARKKLNQVYDAFVRRNGPLNADANKRLFRDDPTWPNLSALEEDFDKGLSPAMAQKTGEQPRKPSAKKAAIFAKRTQSPYAPPERASSARDALVASLAETGRVDLAMMSRLYGKPAETILEELGPLVFEDPQRGPVTADEYLSGNVKQKLAEARAAAQKDARYARNVDALEGVQPADIAPVDINVKIGASWLPRADMEAFVNHLVEGQDAQASYNPVTAKWSIQTGRVSEAARQRWGTPRTPVAEVMEAAANQRTIQVYDRLSDESRVLNEEATQAANQKVEQVKEAFGRWVWSDPDRRTRLARIYNDTFNTNVPRAFDGAHLTFPGKVGDDIIRLRPHQANAVWRILQSNTTLVDHVVGAGKTFTLIAAAMEMRRMGLAKKPMFVVPNHLVGQWAADFTKLYPGANVLAATKRDFEKDNRKRLFARVATGDWDAVIVAHSSFTKLEVEPKEQAAFIEEQIADLETSIALVKDAEGSKSRNVKDITKRRDALREKLKRLFDAENKDNALYWGELGVDALFVDEAHEFKNLAFSTSMNRVAGLGNQTGSQKAADMFLKVRQVLKATGGRNVVFATGTPISNTMAEMYTMQRYMDYDNLKAQGLAHFDAWARMFGEVVTDWELSPSGQYKLNSRFAKFVNMPELMQRYTHFADVINRDDINAMLASQGRRLPVPKIKGGKPENVVVERSAQQAAYIGMPIKDAEGNDTGQYPQGTLVWRTENLPKKAEKGGDNMLKIMGDARKAALDMRLIDPNYPDYAGSKVNEAAKRIKAIYDRWAADRGTQLVFIDLSTPKASKAAEAQRLRDLVARAEGGDEEAEAELDKVSPDDLLALDSDFSVYDDLKQKLIRLGIPEAEIAFIHDANTDIRKEELFGKVRSGRVRVLLGSTAKMGAGMNVQERLVALHHLDAPWRPSDLEQREGRIIRQGNILYERDPEGFEVEILRYATRQTLDSRMWQTIESKAAFIEQVRKGTGVREVEDVASEAANAAEMKAASSGNPLILEEMSLRQRVRALETERYNHERAQHEIEFAISRARSSITASERRIGQLQADIKRSRPKEFVVTIGGQEFTKRKEAGEAILAQAAALERRGADASAEIGRYGDFMIRLDRVAAERFTLTLEGDGTYQTEVEIGNDPTGLAMRVTNLVGDLPGRLDIERERLARNQADIPKLEEQLGQWPRAAELEKAKARHGEVLDQLKPKKKSAKPAAEKPAEGLEAADGAGPAVAPAARPSPAHVAAAIENGRIDAEELGLRAAVEKVLGAKVASRVIFHRTYDALPDRLRAGIMRRMEQRGGRGQTGALYDPETGRVYVFTHVVKTPDRAVWNALHELSGHHGLRALLGDRLGQALQVADQNETVSRVADAIARERNIPRARRQLAVEEALAELSAAVGTGNFDHIRDRYGVEVSEGMRARVQGSIRNFLRRLKELLNDLFGRPVFTDEDVRALLEAARAAATVRVGPPGQRGIGLDAVEAGQTDSPAFRRWFGDSKIVDSAGNPMRVFHGTMTDLQHAVDAKAPLYVTNSPRYANYYAAGEPTGSPLSWDGQTYPVGDMTASEQRAEVDRIERELRELASREPSPEDYEFLRMHQGALDYIREAGIADSLPPSGAMIYRRALAIEEAIRKTTDERQRLTDEWRQAQARARIATPNVSALYAKVENPYRTDNELLIYNLASDPEGIASLKARGYDGVIWSPEGIDAQLDGTVNVPYGAEILVFDASRQIKSATANRGTFDPDSPNILENVEPELEVDPARIRMEKKPLREAVGGALTTLKRHGFLPMTPLNYLVDYARGALRDAVAAYVDTKRAMDAYRGEKHAAYDAHAQRWLAWAAKNPAASAALGQLMHDSTIAQIDPSEELPAKLAGDAGAVQRYNALRERFEALPEEGQALYRDTRDLYKAQAAELDAIIEANVGKQMDLARERADAAYRQELAEIRDSGMEGDERAAAEAAAKQRHVDATAGHRFRKQARMLRLRQMLESNRLAGPYFPLARFGDYTVSIRDQGGELVSFSRFEKPGDAAWFAKQARSTWPSMQVEEGVLTEKEGPTGAVGAKFMADLEEILGGSNVPDSLRDEVWQRYLMTMPDFSMRKRFIHRKGTPGYHRDPIRAFGSAMFHGAHQMARLKYGPDLTAALRDVQRTAIADEDSVNAGILANELKKRHDWVLDPKGAAWAQAISSGAFIWNLAVSPAAALVNLTQTYVLGVPVLGSRLGGVTRALAELSKASAQLFSARGFKLSNRVKGDELRAMEEFYKLGLIDRTQSHDLAGVGETGVEYSVTRQKWMKRLSFLFHHAERVNREVTALAAYRLARQRGQGHDAAVKTASELTWLTHFDYSNSSRARYVQSDVAKVLLIHKQHSLNMTYRLFRDLNDMLRGATPEERKIARSQFVGVMAMHGIMAGVRGMPFYGIAMVVAGLLKDAFGDDDDEREPEDIVKAWLYDSGMPRWMADTLLYGAPSVATGLDISSRVGFPDLFFRSPNKELEGRAEAEYWTMQILGAAAAIPVQVWTGVNTIREGNVARGVEQMMPKFVRDGLKAFRYAREGALTFTGDPIVDEMRAWELVGQAAGFTPFELSKAYDENNARKRLETAINNRRARLMNRYALAWRMEDEAAMDELEREFERFNDAYPEKPITAQSVRSSIRSRERRSARSSGGLVLDSRLEERINRELGLEVEAE